MVGPQGRGLVFWWGVWVRGCRVTCLTRLPRAQMFPASPAASPTDTQGRSEDTPRSSAQLLPGHCQGDGALEETAPRISDRRILGTEFNRNCRLARTRENQFPF